MLYLILLLAPAPAPPPPKKVLVLDVVGRWDAVQWGTTKCRMQFDKDGSYGCDWPGARYVGSWGIRDGKLWITESSRPDHAMSWLTYAIALDPATLKGPVVQGADGVAVHLGRRLP